MSSEDYNKRNEEIKRSLKTLRKDIKFREEQVKANMPTTLSAPRCRTRDAATSLTSPDRWNDWRKPSNENGFRNWILPEFPQSDDSPWIGPRHPAISRPHRSHAKQAS